MIKGKWIITLLLNYYAYIWAVPDEVVFKHISTENGLPSNYIFTIVQDHDGFMWFGTAEGLSRYDGITFLNFSHVAGDTTSLLNNDIQSIAVDHDKGLWIGTQKGLNYLSFKTYTFKQFHQIYKETLDSYWITKVFVFDQQHILMGTLNNGLLFFNHETGEVKTFKRSDKDKNTLINNTIRDIIKINNDVWIATEGGLDKLNLIDMKFEHLLKGVNVQHICIDPMKNIVVTAINDNQIYTISPDNTKIEKKEILDKEFRNKQKKVLFDHKGNRWLGILDEGIFYHNVENDQKIHWQYNLYNPYGLSTNSILTIFEDRNNNIWIGTFDGGVNLISYHQKPFIQLRVNFKNDGLQSNHIRALHQDLDDDIWVGTKSIGMFSRFNRTNLTFNHYKHYTDKPGSLNDEFVLCIEDAQPGF